MDDPYNLEIKPTNEWIDTNCWYFDDKNKYKYKKEKLSELLMGHGFPFNKCRMLNSKWKGLYEENKKKEE